MKHCRLLLGFTLGIFAVGAVGFGASVTAMGLEVSIQRMPPNEAKIMTSVLSKYHLAVDDVNPAAQQKWDGRIAKGSKTLVTSAAAQDVVKQYLRTKLGVKPQDRPNPLQRKQLLKQEQEAKMQELASSGEQLPAPADTSAACLPQSKVKTGNILVLLVEFSDVVHNQLPQPAKENKLDYWVSDFSTGHYQSMLFGRDSKALTMRNYFLEQSNGLYTVDGKVVDWVKVTLPESRYGADSAAGGTDNANGPVWRIVKDALQQVGSKVNWAQYDQEDEMDLDNDGNLQEPNGYIDHLMLVHAGAGQEAGGGAQGDDAIWSHSGWANGGNGGPGMGGVVTSNPNVYAGPYTIMPEDGAIGVFCHEFVHDLGLPDEYDTIYSGEASTAFWTLMSSGSWMGLPQGSKPSGISIWGRIQLGWVKPQVVPYQSAGKLLTLDRYGKLLNNQAIRINLPDKQIKINTNQPYDGKNEWYSGAGDDLNVTLTRSVDLTKVSQAELKFQTWYNIEEDYDFGFVEVSQDGGKTWADLPGNLTRTWEGANVITGKSNGWVEAKYDLAKYAGSKITLRFRYYTDGGYTLPGWAIDQIRIEAAGFSDSVEAGVGDWLAKGWRIYEGQETVVKSQYYLMEQRNHQGFDQCLSQCCSVYATDTADTYPYGPGVLLWLADEEYTDNWVGEHPGHGFLLVVDSHPEPDLFESKPFRTRIQVRDAAFGMQATKAVTLTVPVEKELRKAVLKAQPGTARFSDRLSYWTKNQPENSVIVPQYGVNFRVLLSAPDYSSSMVYIYFDK